MRRLSLPVPTAKLGSTPCADRGATGEHACKAPGFRLHIGELPILWNSGGQKYNPDFFVIDADATHWVVEVKMDKEMTSEDVKAKRDAARRWANHVNADANVDVPWRYLLVSESDVDTARGSWAALKKLGGD